ncbi:MAG: hypothetical protein IPH31_25875 [Lewinellaceae bacterium]|nr:hypothetical protein [Lewinellaceae bacterium]
MLREQFHLTTESLKPINIIKSTFGQTSGSEDSKQGLVSTSVGLTAGYFSKMLFERASNNPFRKVLGTALLVGVTNVIAKNPGIVNSLGQMVVGFVRRRINARKLNASNKPNTLEI